MNPDADHQFGVPPALEDEIGTELKFTQRGERPSSFEMSSEPADKMTPAAPVAPFPTVPNSGGREREREKEKRVREGEGEGGERERWNVWIDLKTLLRNKSCVPPRFQRERERERQREREKERETEKERERVCVCVRERERERVCVCVNV